MDVLVLWKDGSKNIVDIKELKNVKRNNKIKLGSKVKMFYVKKWFYGTVLDICDKLNKNIVSDNSDDDVPLAKLRKKESPLENDIDNVPLSKFFNNKNQFNVAKGKLSILETVNSISTLYMF